MIDVLISTLGRARAAAASRDADQQSLVGGQDDEEAGESNPTEVSSESSKAVALAMILSFGTNVGLLFVKTYVAIATGSMVLLAAAADSLLDILSGAVLFFTERIAHQVGRRKRGGGSAATVGAGGLMWRNEIFRHPLTRPYIHPSVPNPSWREAFRLHESLNKHTRWALTCQPGEAALKGMIGVSPSPPGSPAA